MTRSLGDSSAISMVPLWKHVSSDWRNSKGVKTSGFAHLLIRGEE